MKKQSRPFQLIIEDEVEKDLYNHEEVFDEIRQTPFTLKESAEYLEVAEIT